MKKVKFITSILCLSFLFVGCDNTNNSSHNVSNVSEKVSTAMMSLRRKTHKVNVNQTVTVLKGTDAISITQEYNNVYGFYYEGEERAFSRQLSSLFADIDPISGAYKESTIRTYNNQEEFYFKNIEDGTAYVETINVNNQLTKSTISSYDEDNGIYSPIIYDQEFKNPFDYISLRDVVVNSDNTLSFINSKADYLADCYGTIGLNFIKSNQINLDSNGKITSIDFVIDDWEGETFTRKNTLSITFDYDDNVDAIDSIHLKPFTNDNPILASALKTLENKTNFTYIKEYYSETNKNNNSTKMINHRIKGYFTQSEVFFHHEATENDDTPYINGDYTDYKCKINDSGSYTSYEYVLYTTEYKWNVSKLSGGSAYIIDDFSGIGPSFMNLSASIFKKVDDYTYEIESSLLETIGTYFDYQMLGVQTGLFDGYTTGLSIKLNQDGNIEVINASYISEMIETKVKFYIQDIGTTSIPEWSDKIVTVF